MRFLPINVVLFLLPVCLWANDSQTEINSMILKPLNFVNEVAKSISQIDSNLKSPDKCVEFISDKLDKIDRLKSESFFPQTEQDIVELEQKGEETLKRLFHVQLMVRKKQKELSQQGKLTFDCLQNIRRSTRYVRFMEDMLIEWLIERKKVTQFSNDILSGEFPQLMKNVDKVEFQIGDLFLIRGKSYVSGMIARIGDAELQFSHLAILGMNDKGEKVIVEALIPYGTKVTPFETWLKQKEARVVHFRFNDSDIASKAGRAAFDLANGFISKHGYNIPYDFNMSSLDADNIFCAELIENAYLNASSSKVLLPENKSMTTKFKSTPFLKNMGIESTEIFAPGDIEFDSRFDLLAEYRFLGKYEESDSIPLLRKIRMQDAIIQSIYNWTIMDSYQFVDSWKINMKTVLAKVFRYIGFLKDRMPTHMPYSSLKTVIQFEDTSHILEAYLFPIEETFYAQKKHSLHFQEMLKVLKDFRNAECEKEESEFNNLMTTKACFRKIGREI
tara:strand:- start:67831 stop:69336 length:1506 start_codon:yes stop_codon:yes gene_type:complete